MQRLTPSERTLTTLVRTMLTFGLMLLLSGRSPGVPDVQERGRRGAESCEPDSRLLLEHLVHDVDAVPDFREFGGVLLSASSASTWKPAFCRSSRFGRDSGNGYLKRLTTIHQDACVRNRRTQSRPELPVPVTSQASSVLAHRPLGGPLRAWGSINSSNPSQRLRAKRKNRSGKSTTKAMQTASDEVDDSVRVSTNRG